MKVNWITVADERVASYRYHAMIPARELQLLGHTVSITPQPAGGHRMCAGCGAPVVLRQVLMGTSDPVVVSAATGCLEVSTTIYPYTSWKGSYIHTAFENSAATLSGVETAYRALKKKGLVEEDLGVAVAVVTNHAIALQRMGRYSQAHARFTDAETMLEVLLAKAAKEGGESEAARWVVSLADTHLGFGALLFETGDLAGALGLYRRAESGYRRSSRQSSSSTTAT